MNNLISIRPILLVLFIMGFNSCVNDNAEFLGKDSKVQIDTRGSEFHWTCECGMLNAGWRERCVNPSCEKKYNNEHSNLIMTFMSGTVTTAQKTLEGIGGFSNNRIQLSNLEYTAKAPEPWYDTYKSQTYYENLKTLAYYSDTKYAEGVDLAWYRTVRVLYPGQTNVTKMQYAYDKWLIRDGRFLRDSFGRGLKAGTQAAIDAFGAR